MSPAPGPYPQRRVVGARPGRSQVPVIEGAGAQVRPARIDRPLRTSTLGPTYSDPVLEAMVARAADTAREEARAQGYAAGWAQGRQAAAAEAAATAQRAELVMQEQRAAQARQVGVLLDQLAEAARTTRTAQTIELEEVAAALADAAVELAAAVLDRELAATDHPVRDAVRTALARVADPEAAVVHLHPGDAATMPQPPAGVRLVADPGVPVGAVVVLTPAQRLRLDLPAALAAAREVLTAPAAGAASTAGAPGATGAAGGAR